MTLNYQDYKIYVTYNNVLFIITKNIIYLPANRPTNCIKCVFKNGYLYLQRSWIHAIITTQLLKINSTFTPHFLAVNF